MVAQNSAPAAADPPTAITAAVLRARRWFLEQKLYRRNWTDYARVLGKVIAIRLYAAAACLISMLPAAWIGAFVRVISAVVFSALNAGDKHILPLSGATRLALLQAGRYPGHLFPVLCVWAVLLVLTPPGHTAAFRAAVIAAGVLGCLRFTPPPFLITVKVAPISHWLGKFDSRSYIPCLIASVIMVYVFQRSAASTFLRLGRFRGKPSEVPFDELSSYHFIRRVCALPLILLILLSTVWAAAVVQLAATGASGQGNEVSYGFVGAFYQSKYLFVLALSTVIITQTTHGGRWLAGAVTLTAVYGLMPRTGPFHIKTQNMTSYQYYLFPPKLQFSAGRGQLVHIGTLWGTDTLWAALFIYVPAVVLGMYLANRLLRSPRYLVTR